MIMRKKNWPAPSMPKTFYITTTLPYVNSDPHVGFAMEIIRADAVARFRRLMGDEVFFNTGTDEHGLKIYEKAMSLKQSTQSYVDDYAEKFKALKELLNLSYTNFIRTTDEHHIEAAQEFWQRCLAAGDIYKKHYQTKYCPGCELERYDWELENGRCFLHPNVEIIVIEEENYFFRFSKYQDQLLELYRQQPDFVLPPKRFNEIRSFVERGLQDFSISRLTSKMPWGIPVPNDPEHVMYVWFDALVNYISAIGWPNDQKNFATWWPVTQYCGKDNLRQQASMWQAMLLSAGLGSSKQIIVNGFINGAGGVKMSKSLGNVIAPKEVVVIYGADALRYFLIREIAPFEDGDFTWERFKETYNGNLANGLGNLVSRIMKMASTHLDEAPAIPENTLPENYKQAFANFDLKKAADLTWERINDLDKQIQETEPFKLVKVNPAAGKELIAGLVVELYTVARMLNPLMPQTSVIIKDLIKGNKSPETPLFLRQD